METIWVTKYALTEGIKRCEWDGKTSDGGYIFPIGYCFAAKFGKDAYKNEADAKAEADKMRLRKIVSLKKSIQKLEGMRFDA